MCRNPQGAVDGVDGSAIENDRDAIDQMLEATDHHSNMLGS